MNNEFAEISPTRSLSLSFSLEFSFPRECYTRDKWFATSHLSDFIEWTKVIVFSTRPIRIVYHEYKRGRGEKGGGEGTPFTSSKAMRGFTKFGSFPSSYRSLHSNFDFFLFPFPSFFFSFFRSISKLGINSLEPARANYSSLKSKAIGSERFFFFYSSFTIDFVSRSALKSFIYL